MLSRLQLESIVASIPAAVIVIEKETGAIIYANERADLLFCTKLKGFKIPHDTEKVIKVFALNGEQYSFDQLPARQALAKGTMVQDEFIIERPNGSRVVVKGLANPVKDVYGEILAAVAVFEDITDKKVYEETLRDSEERFRLVAEAAKVMVYEIEIGKDAVKVFSGEEVLGYGKGEIPNSNKWWLNQIHGEDSTGVQLQTTQVWVTGRDVLLEYRIKRKQGDFIYVHDTIKAVKDERGKVVRLIGGVRDVTERKLHEETLRNSHDLLEQKAAEVAEYATNMENLANERLRQLKDAERLAAIGATAGMVGHDIRNPLQAIVGDVYLLRDYLSGMPDSITVKHDVAESLEEIEKNVSYINKIVADLQDYSRAITLELKDANLYDLVISAFRTIVVPENVNPSLGIDPKINLKTDPTLFTRILTNLVINAIQAMPKGGNLSIIATKKQGSIVFSVADTGVGIPEDVKLKLFTPMMTTKAKGQGLGLAVVKRLVEALNGTISFESQVGKGTKFIIELPLNQ